MMLNHSSPLLITNLLHLLPNISPFPLPLRIYLAGERTTKNIKSQQSNSPLHSPRVHGDLLFIRQRNAIYQQHLRRQQHPRRSAIQQRRPQKAHRAPVIHRRAGDVEREARHGLIHQDAKVIPQVRARDAEGPCGGEDEDVATYDEEVG